MQTRLDEVAAAIGDPDRVATVAVDVTDDDGPARIVSGRGRALGSGRLPDQQRRSRQPDAAARHRRRDVGHFLNVMLRAPFRLARDVLPHMQAGSAIINITSTFAVVGGLRGGPYSAAKGGLTALTTHIACQYGAHGIRCNAVAPGRDPDADDRRTAAGSRGFAGCRSR